MGNTGSTKKEAKKVPSMKMVVLGGGNQLLSVNKKKAKIGAQNKKM